MGKSLIKEKSLLRKEMLQKRQELASELARKWSDWVQMHFLGGEGYRQAKIIALYAGFDQEVGTRMVFERAKEEGKILAFPRITGKGKMVFLKVDDYEKMVRNQYGILEPRPDWEEIPLKELELMIVPGVAFDRRGFRLGFGGGYYDRILAQLKPETLTVGFAYLFQVVESLPVDVHDQRVKRLVTEQGFIRLTPEKSGVEDKNEGGRQWKF